MLHIAMTRERSISKAKKVPYPFLGLALLIYGLVMFPQFRNYHYGFDCFYFLGRAKEAASHPFSIFQADFALRFHPLYHLLESFVYRFFGINPLAQGALLVPLHLLNVFLLFRLMLRLGISNVAALTGSVLFLFLSSHWGVVFDIAQVARLGGIVFFLGSLIAFKNFLETKNRWHYFSSLIFLAVSFGFAEDPVILPPLLGRRLKPKTAAIKPTNKPSESAPHFV